MVWARVPDGFQQTTMSSDGLDPRYNLEERGMPESVTDFNSKMDLELLGVTWEEALYLAKDHSEWRNCTAR